MTDVDTEQEKKIFVARQPIFDRDEKIYGYELLFRRGLENFFDENLDKDFASSKVLLDSFILFDLKELTRGKRAFLNFTGPVLLSDLALAFKTDSIVVELLENIEPKPNIIASCKKLKSKGYTLALDDFEYNPRSQPLIDLADIIKIDFLATQGEERQEVIEKSSKKHIKFLAEKVETIEEYNQGREIGYAYFQGYYFSKPVIVSGRDVPSCKVNLLQVLKEIHRPDTSVTRLEEIIKRDVSLVYKLLRFINSAAFGLRSEVRSIRHALNLLGTIEFKKWMSMMLLSQLGSGKPDELMINSLTRAKFCELTAESIRQKHRQSDFFLMGLFSLIDAFLDRPMTDILAELPISADIKTAVLEQKGHLGQVLRLIVNYEQSKWNIVSQISQSLDIDENKILDHYFTSIKWANDFPL
jgi:EAL and modified HD-GYP domain-containing signal transduction protein